MAQIQLKKVTKGWGSVVGVDNVDLDIRDEEFMVFLGPSGCGKTTTMRMIAGLNDLSSGEIWIDGELVNEFDPRDRDVAMVFQSYALYPNMTVYENIRFPLRMRGIPKAEHDARVRRAADMVELGAYLDRKPGALSGGQRQRAALARAIVRQPRVFLMDEPLSNLDAKLRNAMRVQLKHVQRQLKITTIYVTHDQVEAMTLADRIVIMDKGRIQQLGTPDEIYSNPNNTFVAGFIGSPPMNLIKGEVRGKRFSAPGVEVAGITLPDSRAVILGVRPEDAKVATGTAAHLKGQLYGLEPTGDQTFLSVRTDAMVVEVKADRDFRQPLDTSIAIELDPERLYFFDAESGQRIRLN
ncbi:ABC transporter ATP-binding protein [Mesorhizobium sp.]|uniref:ABC transporter ATP-binding protein n=1 Tax=Mesorhizobium sp. TaxID=1871066 RepID=UPI0011F8FE87|nr:ABC transporter ATP-binding protein [Mesorhizobium sp.]TIW99159.1 MAG: ABC transporter ATP-binding protein [Mesorhizobium sp.]